MWSKVDGVTNGIIGQRRRANLNGYQRVLRSTLTKDLTSNQMATYREHMLVEARSAPRKPEKGDIVISADGGMGPIRKLASAIAYVDLNARGSGTEQLAPVFVKDLSLANASGATLRLPQRKPGQKPYLIWQEND